MWWMSSHVKHTYLYWLCFSNLFSWKWIKSRDDEINKFKAIFQNLGDGLLEYQHEI